MEHELGIGLLSEISISISHSKGSNSLYPPS
jgi:hypothetical protein